MQSENRRRKPTQARARETIDIILRATAQVLIADGYDRASTNRIARVAGVSVGSLYQYFPNKQAVVAALAHDHVSRTMSVVEAGLLEHVSTPLAEAIPKIVHALIKSQQIDPDLHRVMVQQAPVSAFSDAKRGMATLLKAWMEARSDEIRLVDLDMAAFVLVEAVDATICTAVLEHPAFLEGDDLQRELTDLVLRYVLP